MRHFSQEWFDALSVARFSGNWVDLSGPKNAPVMPWITPPVHPILREAFQSLGSDRVFKTGEWLYPHVQVRSFMLVESGLTGRIVATKDGQPGEGAMALSTPMRNAAGNLNWITHRAAIGRYQALSPVRLREIPHSEAMAFLLASDRYFSLVLHANNELINLSDRLGFAALALLPAEDRFKVLLTAWGLFYGRLFDESGKIYVRMPTPGRRANMAQVIRVSNVTLDNLLSGLKRKWEFRREGDFITFNVAALQDVHEWMRHAEGEDAYLSRPQRVEDMLFAAQAEEASQS